jgi:hypothetical protein
VNRPVER